ncbi:unnamed protein product, partial [Didymodactylos carnosus]
GVSYRGVKMTNEDLRGYRWTFRSAGVIETRTFCSTSSDRGVAEQFADTSTTDVDDKESVLMMFHFGEKCDTAINLNKLSPDLPCISEYEDEAEVLLLPLTFFNVKQIEQTSSYLAISLENVPSKRRSLLGVLKVTYDSFWSIDCTALDLKSAAASSSGNLVFQSLMWLSRSGE